MDATETRSKTETTGGGAGRQLDWVTVLGREHAEELFRRLHEVVQRDVASARKHARADPGKVLGFGQIEFHCSDVERWYFGVSVMPAGIGVLSCVSGGTSSWRPGVHGLPSEGVTGRTVSCMRHTRRCTRHSTACW